MARTYTGALAALTLLSGCGSTDSAANASTTAARRTAAVRPAPAAAPKARPWDIYYIPHEWADQVSANHLWLHDPSRLQIFAMYLYQNPEALENPAVQQALVGLYSCADNDIADSNEIRAPAIRAKYVAMFRGFARSTKPEAVAMFRFQLGKYNAGTQRFSWNDAGSDQPLGIRFVDGKEVPVCGSGSRSVLHGMDGAYTIAVHGAAIPGLHFDTAAADRYLQSHPGREVELTLRLAILPRPTLAAGKSTFGSDVAADATATEAVFRDPQSNQVIATVRL